MQPKKKKYTTSQKPNHLIDGSGILFHTSLLVGIYIFLFFICYPVLVNADILTSGDEAYHFRQIIEFLQGRFFLYYDNVTYAGILEGLAAIPFFWVLGVNFMAFKIPSILFFGLFIWSSFILARIIQPKMAWVWLSMLLFPPTLVVNEILTLNYCNSLTFFLANLILINFYKYKMGSNNHIANIILVGFLCGLSIYVYAYSIIYIFPLAVLICLTHSKWESIRSRINFQIVIQTFSNLDSGRAILTRCLDIVIICFFLAITFAYTFGGFGLDIAGVTLLQINNLYKPVFQCLVLIFIRFIISKGKISHQTDKFRYWLSRVPFESKKLTSYVIAGFLLGMSPRIISIFSGNISRGGQGLDMDFLPTKMAAHAITLFTEAIPDSLDIRFQFTKLLPPGSLGHGSFWYPTINFLILIFIFIVTFEFIRKNKLIILKMVGLRQLNFNGELFFILFPATMFGALIISMNGPILHYLAPMYWVITFYASLYLTQIKQKSIILFMCLFLSWVTFYTINNFNNYYLKGVLGEGRVKIKTNPLIEIIEFCKIKKIKWIYANYGDTGSTYILSKGDVFAAENTSTVRGKRWKKELSAHQDFAILLPSSAIKIYISFLQKSKIAFQKKEWKSRTLIWNFKGNPTAVNQLRRQDIIRKLEKGTNPGIIHFSEQ